MGQGRSHRGTLVESDRRRPARVRRTPHTAAPVGSTVEHALRRFMQLGSVGGVDDRDPEPGPLRVG
ncbi:MULTISPECIES: hypothetical protein [unclassified Solwaraspora]|uniref:hypothetical protein n=1 Tax=unclassified Solwaraspora TaxID=2627926 RepID=UPI00259B305C|nr:hypothetical protein [Solwaraspora sp. WMMA2056]WJK41017.1 hypothetical protein O7608_00715 [Solwaraspora sp. WMMA2056]